MLRGSHEVCEDRKEFRGFFKVVLQVVKQTVPAIVWETKIKFKIRLGQVSALSRQLCSESELVSHGCIFSSQLRVEINLAPALKAHVFAAPDPLSMESDEIYCWSCHRSGIVFLHFNPLPLANSYPRLNFMTPLIWFHIFLCFPWSPAPAQHWLFNETLHRAGQFLAWT